MAYKPQHPDNPCRDSLPEAEQIPAKMWELLRRNGTFKKAVARLAQLDARAKKPLSRIQELLARGVNQGHPTPEARELEAECRRHSEAAFVARRMLENVSKSHPFAGAALQWLIPEFRFEIHHVVIDPEAEITGDHPVPLKVIKIESGSTPDPNDKANWHAFEAHGKQDAFSRRNHAGCAPMVRGPLITYILQEDPRLQRSKVNAIQEWKDYQESHGPFTLNDYWRTAPPGFKRIFCSLWRNCDSSEKNPLTGNRDDVPTEHETHFFQNWRLMKTLARVAKSGQLTSDDLATSLHFDDLAENYRVFAFPTSIRTRTEARRLSKWLLRQLVSELPRHQKKILGSPLQWDIFLTVEDQRRRGLDFSPALEASFTSLYCFAKKNPDEWAKPYEDEADNDPEVARSLHASWKLQKGIWARAWSDRGHSWLADYRRIDGQFEQPGMIQLVFPRLEGVLSASPFPASS